MNLNLVGLFSADTDVAPQTEGRFALNISLHIYLFMIISLHIYLFMITSLHMYLLMLIFMNSAAPSLKPI